MPDSSLGENTNYPTGYDPSILVGLNRATQDKNYVLIVIVTKSLVLIPGLVTNYLG